MSPLWNTEADNPADRGEAPLNEDFAAPGKARVDPDLLRSLMKKSDMAGGLQLASHLVAIACSGTGLWLTWGSWWGVLFFAAHGMLINWLYAAQHEATHDTVFRRRWMNEWLGRVTGFILIYPRDHDRWQHLCHHRHTQDPERDSELAFENAGRFAGWLSLSGLSFWRGLVTNLVHHAATGRRHPRFEYYLTTNMERRVVAEARWHLAGYTLIAALSVWSGSWAAVTMWLAPMLAMSWTHQIQNIIEHTGMPFTDDTWTNTRTVRTNPLMRWLAWQMVYHTAHHTYPGVPFHRLAALNRAIIEARGEEPVTSTYLEQFARTLGEPFRRPA